MTPASSVTPPRAALEPNGREPLKGLRVVEIGVAMAGPFCAMLLGDYGADVVKLERPQVGDDSRSWSPYFHESLSYYYAAANRNKRSVSVDIKTPEGAAIARKLLEQADVLVTNFRLGALDRCGLDYDSLSRINPRLIYCAISGFGAAGPLSAEPANDLFMQAYSGGMSITGEPGGSPAKMGMSVADVGAGLFATIGVLMALQVRQATGQGQRVDASLLEGQMAMLTQFFTRYYASGEVPGPSGSGALSSPTYRAFQGSDDWIVIAAFNQRMWRGLCAALEQPQWVDDPRFVDGTQRSDNRQLLIGMIAAVMKTRPIAHWQEAFQRHEVPCSAVHTIDKVVVQPQVLAAQMVQQVELSGLGMMSMPGLPLKFSASPGSIRLAPPRLGQHTQAVMQELGYAPAQIAQWVGSGVIELDQGWTQGV
jgi:crotonobetainyl-CoA:carnitine CoA-transferase CaiB-like acyl-CoA transferase